MLHTQRGCLKSRLSTQVNSVINSVKNIPSCGAKYNLTDQEISRPLWNPQVSFPLSQISTTNLPSPKENKTQIIRRVK